MATPETTQEVYVGPRPFERGERRLFFGRDHEISELLSLVISSRVVLLYAPSGAGKTSLINAGLLPRLEAEGFEVLPPARVRGLIPAGVDQGRVTNVYALNALLSLAEMEAPEGLLDRTLAQFLADRPHPVDEEGFAAPRILIFDQFEELLTFYPERWRDRAAFYRQVREALQADPLLRVFLVIREDYVARLDPYHALLKPFTQARFRLDRMGRRGALSAVTGPLQGTGRRYGEGVAEALVEELLKVRVETARGETEEVVGSHVEPVQLQVVCRNLWLSLPPGEQEISRAHLRAFGDVDEALRGFYEDSLHGALAETSAREAELRAWFERELVTPAGTRGTAYRGSETTAGLTNEVVDYLENRHLIRGEYRAGSRWYELTHDRFIQPIQRANETWRARRRGRRGRLVAAGMIVLLTVLLAAGVFTTQQSASQAGSLATAALATASEAEEMAGVAEATALAAATSQAQAEVAAAEAEAAAQVAQATVVAAEAAASELANAVARSRVRPLRPGLSAGTTSGSVITLGAFARSGEGAVALVPRAFFGTQGCSFGAPAFQPAVSFGGSDADNQVGTILLCPDGLLSGDGETAWEAAGLVGLVRLGVPSVEEVEAAQGLLPVTSGGSEALTMLAVETGVLGVGPVYGIGDPASGLPVQMLGLSGALQGEILRPPGEVEVEVLPGLIGQASGAVLTDLQVAAGDEGSLVVTTGGEAVGIVVGSGNQGAVLAPLRDVLSRLGVEFLHLGKELLTLRGHQAAVTDARWSRRGLHFATASADGTARLWSAEGERLAVLAGHSQPVQAIRFSPMEDLVLTASMDGTAILWDLSGRRVALLGGPQGHLAGLVDAAFSPDGRRIVTAALENTARLWDTEGNLLARLRGHESGVTRVAFSPEGSLILTGSSDDTARLWDAEGGEVAVLRGHRGSLTWVAFSPDGLRLLTASRDGTAKVWDLEGDLLATLEGHEGAVNVARFSPDGSQILTAGQDGTARLWESGGRLLATLEGHEGPVLQAAFSPGGGWLATASADGLVRLWTAEGEAGPALEGHRISVRALQYSPDGTRLLTAGDDSTARVWQGK